MTKGLRFSSPLLLTAKEFTFHSDVQHYLKLSAKLNPSGVFHGRLGMCHLPGSLPVPILDFSPMQNAHRPPRHAALHGVLPTRDVPFELLLLEQTSRTNTLQSKHEQLLESVGLGLSCSFVVSCFFFLQMWKKHQLSVLQGPQDKPIPETKPTSTRDTGKL